MSYLKQLKRASVRHLNIHLLMFCDNTCFKKQIKKIPKKPFQIKSAQK